MVGELGDGGSPKHPWTSASVDDSAELSGYEPYGLATGRPVDVAVGGPYGLAAGCLFDVAVGGPYGLAAECPVDVAVGEPHRPIDSGFVVLHEDPAELRPVLGKKVDETPESTFDLPERSPEPEEQHSDVAQREASEFVTSTVKALADFLIQRMADAHGLTLPYNAVKLVYGAYQWERVGEDGGGVDIQVPLMGNNPILDVTFHLGGDPDTPLITFSLAPDGESGVGAVAIGKLEMDPAPRHAEVTSSWSQLPEKCFGPVQLVPLQLPSGLRNGLEPADAAAAARDAAQDVLPQLLSERQHLRDAGVELVLGCAAELGLALWVHLGDTNRSERVVTGTAGDRLSIELIPEAVDLIIGPGPETGLTVSLHRRDFQQSADEVPITWRTPDQPGIEQQNEAKIGQNEAEIVPSEAVRTKGAAAPGPGAGSVASAAAASPTGGPMTGPDHYRRAEELAAKAHEYLGQAEGQDSAAAWAAIAQVHATLALAAATALGKRDPDNRAWADAAGTKY